MDGAGYGKPPIPPSAYVPVPNSNGATCGKFRNESDAWKDFDTSVQVSRAFKLYREVLGDYIQPRPFTELKRAKIDRLLVPNEKALAAGWTADIIGVEIKRSGEKLGPPICQAMDYLRCVFELPSGFLVMPRWVFVFPVDNPHGPLESVMVQNRIGFAEPAFGGGITFNVSGCSGVLRLWPDGNVTTQPITCGNKRGSR